MISDLSHYTNTSCDYDILPEIWGEDPSVVVS